MAVVARERGAVVRKRSYDRPVQWLIAVVTVALVLFPLWPILYQAVLDKPLYDTGRSTTLANFSRVFTSRAFWKVCGTTLLFAGLTTIVSVIVGVTFALLLTRTDIPLRGLFTNLVVIPFYVSPLVLAFAWIIVFGPQGYVSIFARDMLHLPKWNLYSIGGIAAVASVYYVPYTYLYCTASLALSDPQLEDASRISGAGPIRALWSITLPLMRPAIAFSVLLTFVSAIELLSIPLVLGTPSGVEVLSSYLYTLGLVGSSPDYGAIAAISIFMLLIVTGLVWVQGRLVSEERRYVTVGGKATRARRVQLGPLRWVCAGVLGLYILLGTILPLLGILAQSCVAFLSPLINPLTVRTGANYRLIWATPEYRGSILHSLLISVIGGAVGMFFIALIALVVYRSDFKGRRALSYVALYPRAMPGIIVGIGFLWAYLLIPRIGSVRNTLFALTAAFIMRYIPLGFGAVGPSILRVSGELDRAARVAGSTWLGTVRSILLPLLRPALLSGYILLFITFLKEYSAALFLYTRGSEVMGTTMIELWRQGDSGPVAALSTVQLVITVIALFIGQKLLGAKLHE